MKRIFLILPFLFVCNSSVFSQKIQFYGGVGPLINIANYQGLNFVINRYNKTRNGQSGNPTLTHPFNNVKAMYGYNANLGIGIAANDHINLYFSASRASRLAFADAEAKTTIGDVERRDLLVASNSVGLDIAVGRSIATPNHVLTFILGVSIDMVTNKVSTQINRSGYIAPMRKTIAAITPFGAIRYTFTPRIFIEMKPTYQLGLQEFDYEALNKEINPETYQEDSRNNLVSRANSFSLQATVNYIIYSN